MRAMTSALRGISSMATKKVLADLAADWERQAGGRMIVKAVGGVDAAKRVAAGEAFDAVFLAADAIDKLMASGNVVAGSRVDLVRSGVAVAVKAGAPRPVIDTEAAVRAAVLAAPSIGYSTGPSGTALLQLFERWGITSQVHERLKQAQPGVPVGSMVASGDVALGFQQYAELKDLAGIDVVGPLPPAIQITTTFSGAIATASSQPQAVRDLLAWMAAPATADTKRRNGMDPA
jgi:molybdate transport system substrate-binding protein